MLISTCLEDDRNNGCEGKMSGAALAVLKPNKWRLTQLIYNILEDFENASQIYSLFLQTVYAIGKLLAGFNLQSTIGMNQ